MNGNLYVQQGVDCRDVFCPRCQSDIGRNCVDTIARRELFVPHAERVVICGKKPVQGIRGQCICSRGSIG